MIIYTLSQDDGIVAGSADVSFTGLIDGDAVALSDDPFDLLNSGSGLAAGGHQWDDNADGGVVHYRCGPTATLLMTDVVGLDEWMYVDADGTMTALQFDDLLELTCNEEPSTCRTNCVVPTCGDGFLDPGEECDDGDGIDCPADCDL